jgi:hypothetical protein
MLRGVRLALWCMVAIAAAPALATDGGHLMAAAQGADAPGTPIAQPALRARYVAISEVKLSIEPPHLPSCCSSATSGKPRSPSLGTSNGGSGMAVALTERFQVGLGYRYLEGEDLWPEFADTGATGYESHHLLIRASWRF